eukprot:GHVU01125116.1.p1 GENE.GHVU01125116.1~~GHVU01125116.1.p1  ORF type:complete len:322 (-),score=62.69 GHVU01125116.1:2310-3185(-)
MKKAFTKSHVVHEDGDMPASVDESDPEEDPLTGWEMSGHDMGITRDDVDDDDDDYAEFTPIDPNELDLAVNTLDDWLIEANPNGLISRLRTSGYLPLWRGCCIHDMQLSVRAVTGKTQPAKETVPPEESLPGDAAHHTPETAALVAAILDSDSARSLADSVALVTKFVTSARKSHLWQQFLDDHELYFEGPNGTRWDSTFRMLKSVRKVDEKVDISSRHDVATTIPVPDKSALAACSEATTILRVPFAFTTDMQEAGADISRIRPAITNVINRFDRYQVSSQFLSSNVTTT